MRTAKEKRIAYQDEKDFPSWKAHIIIARSTISKILKKIYATRKPCPTNKTKKWK